MTLPDLLAFAGRHPVLSLSLGALTIAIVFNELSGLMRGFKGLGPALHTSTTGSARAAASCLFSGSNWLGSTFFAPGM